MFYALTVGRLNTVFFLEERPEGVDGELREDVTLDVPADYASWGEEEPEPVEGVLCVSTADPACFKLFKHLWEVDRASFRPLPQSFGGIYSRAAWDALRAVHPALRPKG